ncbi:acyltransferase family protein [Methylogaea oryzae]|uniref:Acyltransferase n=2 Tax=Methylogaea oryzae TaxID=1295382 RepID=A0A8D5ALJ9_9GAMM|nr:acyltransferase [Methylogaea oryzae]BBL70200.1 acyltransferase [Methylogaea oryzae]
MTLSANSVPQRFYSLDATRGFCSLAVVMWHWKNLFYNGTTPGVFDAKAQPFYAVLFPFYEKGYLAVDFFFCLSGFLFFWLYGTRISRLEISMKEFFWLRFTKLYPVHLCMLIAVLLGQQLMLSKTGDFFVNPGNDAYHFALNVFLATGWGLQRAASYNLPVWSISVEVLLYSLFFLICRKNVFHWCWAAIGVLTLMVLSGRNSDLGRGLFSFFAGGFVYYLYAKMAAQGLCQRWKTPLSAATIAGFAVAVLDIKLGFVTPAINQLMEAVLAPAGYGYDTAMGGRIAWLLVTGWLFPVALLTLVTNETARGAMGKTLSPLGDLSYSLYLTHFPLQLFFAYGVAAMGWDKSFYYTDLALLCFMGLLLALSFASHHYVECPIRRYLRNGIPGWNSIFKPVPQTT